MNRSRQHRIGIEAILDSLFANEVNVSLSWSTERGFHTMLGTRRWRKSRFRPASTFEVGLNFRCNRLATEKLPHETRRLFGLLEMRQMAGSGDQRDAGIGDPLGKILRVVGR